MRFFFYMNYLPVDFCILEKIISNKKKDNFIVYNHYANNNVFYILLQKIPIFIILVKNNS